MSSRQINSVACPSICLSVCLFWFHCCARPAADPRPQGDCKEAPPAKSAYRKRLCDGTQTSGHKDRLPLTLSAVDRRLPNAGAFSSRANKASRPMLTSLALINRRRRRRRRKESITFVSLCLLTCCRRRPAKGRLHLQAAASQSLADKLGISHKQQAKACCLLPVA